jgi:hypothetical protein
MRARQALIAGAARTVVLLDTPLTGAFFEPFPASRTSGVKSCDVRGPRV